ncbi:MAG: septal ring lytic transglycosylase RlpA family protein, partial [Alphaproteobacteria bacterium]|nr:septal ring lytic transglycosylase RlpA family protein [Alphaproteobacteria bacterium]
MISTQSALWRALRVTAGATLLCTSLSACGSLFFGDGAPRSQGAYKVGNPYVINGVRYVPHEDPSYSQVGTASWYGSENHGKRTANGEIFDMYAMSAAHTTLPMPSMVRVTNLENG